MNIKLRLIEVIYIKETSIYLFNIILANSFLSTLLNCIYLIIDKALAVL